MFSAAIVRGNGVTRRTQKVIQGGDNGHVGRPCESSIDMYNNDVGKESAQKFMKQTGDLKAATLYFAS